jgi:hypothetical protein
MNPIRIPLAAAMLLLASIPSACADEEEKSHAEIVAFCSAEDAIADTGVQERYTSTYLGPGPDLENTCPALPDPLSVVHLVLRVYRGIDP